MEIEEDEDAYLTAIDYSYDYLLEGLTDNEQSPSPSQLFSLVYVNHLLKCKPEPLGAAQTPQHVLHGYTINLWKKVKGTEQLWSPDRDPIQKHVKFSEDQT